MFKKIKEYFRNKRNYKNAKKSLTLLLMTQYSDFLMAQTETKKAETEAYNAMAVFGDSFQVEDLQSTLEGIQKIAGSPELTSQFYSHIADMAQKENNPDSKVAQ